jgi:hypothetical protein
MAAVVIISSGTMGNFENILSLSFLIHTMAIMIVTSKGKKEY